jgi:hypothetical protein
MKKRNRNKKIEDLRQAISEIPFSDNIDIIISCLDAALVVANHIKKVDENQVLED